MSKSEYLTEQEIVDACTAVMTDEDRAALKNLYPTEKDLFVLHHGYGTFVRNEYKLWDPENPLTAQWFKDCAEAPDRQHQYMENGVDCHPLHPDQVSFEIIKKIWRGNFETATV